MIENDCRFIGVHGEISTSVGDIHHQTIIVDFCYMDNPGPSPGDHDGNP